MKFLKIIFNYILDFNNNKIIKIIICYYIVGKSSLFSSKNLFTKVFISKGTISIQMGATYERRREIFRDG